MFQEPRAVNSLVLLGRAQGAWEVHVFRSELWLLLPLFVLTSLLPIPSAMTIVPVVSVVSIIAIGPTESILRGRSAMGFLLHCCTFGGVPTTLSLLLLVTILWDVASHLKSTESAV